MICLYCLKDYDKEVTWATIFKADNKGLCPECSNYLEPISEEKCGKCGREYDEQWFVNKHICRDCIAWENQPDYKEVKIKNTSLYKYNNFAKEFVAKWKYRGDYELVYAFSDEIKKLYKRKYKKFDYIITIPLSKERSYERSFNQSEAIAKLMDQKKIIQVFKRVESNKQSKKKKIERIHSENPFIMTDFKSTIDKKVLIVDDIYTTGTTMYRISKLLYEAGASEISTFALFRG
ncbi:MAG: late competence protein [Bacillales bacterium]|jgi:competence protein ComFC|nr:late competence protein [Bacillales bacterium]